MPVVLAEAAGLVSPGFSGNCGFVIGKVGTAAQFNLNTQYESLTMGVAWTLGTGGFWVSCWVNFTKRAGHDNLITSGNSFKLYYSDADGAFRFDFTDNAAVVHTVLGPAYTNATTVKVDAWWDSTLHNIYILVGSAAQTSTAVGVITAKDDNGGTLSLGNTNSGDQNYLNGWVDELGFWNRAPTAAELNIMASGVSNPLINPIAATQGGTGTNMGLTGGQGEAVFQDTVGGPLTARAITTADMPGAVKVLVGGAFGGFMG